MRPSEWLLAGYFVYTALLAQVLPLRSPIPALTAILNLTILAGYALLVYAHSFRRPLHLAMVRDWFPFPLLLLAYREMGWFAQPQVRHRLEEIWVGWDRAVLYGLGLKSAIESLGPLVPGILEISYTLVYTLGPLAVAILYCAGRRERVDAFLFTFAMAVLLAYAQFPLWPSEPPRTVFPGRDFPAYDTVFRRFNWWMLGGYGIHTSVFPSAHVSGAFSAAFAMMRLLPEKPWAGRFLLLMAVLIATATVYGRYHYFADAAAGLGLALAAEGVSRMRSTTAASTAGREKTIGW